MQEAQSDGLETAIRTYDLTKKFNNRTAVNKLSLTVRRGEIYGFLGPNGAGKTTTIRMLLGLLQPTHGYVKIFEQNLGGNHPKLRQRFGVVGEHLYLYDDMTAWEYLDFFSRLYGVEARRSEFLMERFNLTPYGHLLANDFSQGMKRKLSLARALLHDPDVLILDEPTSGLDPYGIKQVRELLEEKRNEGCAIFLSSHILSEIEKTANRVGIVQRGQLLIEDTLETVTAHMISGAIIYIELESEVPGLADKLRKLNNIQKVNVEGSKLVIEGDKDSDLRPSISKAITSLGGVIIGMNMQKTSLEEVFIHLTEAEVPGSKEDSS